MNQALHQAIIDRAEAHPHVVALRSGSDSLTYAEVAATSAAIGRSLSSQGHGPGSLIGVYMPRTPQLVVALLGVLRSGSAYLPLDPDDPPRRVAMLLADSGAAAVITVESLSEILGGTASVLSFEDLLEPSPDVSLPVVAGDDLAYVIFTSGSTGRPKGVAVPHSCAVALLDAMTPYLVVEPGNVWLSLTSATFDISVFEFFGTLGLGMTVEVADISGPQLFSTALSRDDHDITHMQATPTLLYGLMFDPKSRAGMSRLDHLTSTGEALSPALAKELSNLLPAVLLNAYGPTETTVWSSVGAVEAPVGASVTIGEPLEGQQIHVLDSTGARVSHGEVGELFIGGCGVAWGYVGRTGLTAERFMADPFAESPGARMYRTGDLGLRQSDGSFVCLGRNDRQIKLSGHRIELDEVEHTLLALDEVPTGAVIVVGAKGSQRIVAVVKGDGETGDGRRIRSKLAERLASAAVPSEVRFVAELPTTTSGKIDRRALGDCLESTDEAGEQPLYTLAVNDRGQHALWWASRQTPDGWRRLGSAASAAECSAAADSLWADIRPIVSS